MIEMICVKYFSFLLIGASSLDDEEEDESDDEPQTPRDASSSYFSSSAYVGPGLSPFYPAPSLNLVSLATVVSPSATMQKPRLQPKLSRKGKGISCHQCKNVKLPETLARCCKTIARKTSGVRVSTRYFSFHCE